MNADLLQRFETHRRRLQSVAYRMLGTRDDAEDVVQDVWLRWRDADHATIASDEAWLVSVTTRASIDRLRALKVQRAAYPGIWLPEPLVAPLEDQPDLLAERADDLSMALLVVLERLGPEERAAFLLRQVFDHDYPDIARVLGKTEAAVRQLVHRAKDRVTAEQPRFEVPPEEHRAQLQRFATAARTGDIGQIAALFAPDVTMRGDGGGRVPSVPKVLVGADRIARLFHVVARRLGDRLTYTMAMVNGAPGLVRYLDGQLETVFSIVTSADGVRAIYAVRNPDKLRHTTTVA
ncbi:MAG: RNA polymerase sigma-70 factor [Rhizobacter sp.]